MARLTRHAEEQRRYRARLRAKAKATADGTAPRGAPESRAVIQSLAAGVRRLSAEIEANPKVAKTPARVLGELLQAAYESLTEAGYDRDESFQRLHFYCLPDDLKSRRRRADIEKRYWEQPPKPGVPRANSKES